MTITETLQKSIVVGDADSGWETMTVRDLLDRLLYQCCDGALKNEEILDIVAWLDDVVSTWQFTRAIYSYAQDILAVNNELPEEES